MHQIIDANTVRNEYIMDGFDAKPIRLSLYMFHERAAVYVPF